MHSVLITGASRGIGLEFARQYSADGWRVFACCRNPEDAHPLAELVREREHVSVHRMDVLSEDSVRAAAAEMKDISLDLLVNNAGIYGPRDRETLGRIDYEAWRAVLDTNVLGPTRVAEAFADRMAGERGAVLATLSSRLGSISENSAGGRYIYRSSKAAVNMVVKNLAIELGARGIVVVAFHPGWVRTDMGGPAAAVTPSDSVSGMRRVIAGLGPNDNAGFFDHEGSAITW